MITVDTRISQLEGTVFEDEAGTKYLIVVTSNKYYYQVMNLTTFEIVDRIISIHTTDTSALRDIKRGIEANLKVKLVKRYRHV